MLRIDNLSGNGGSMLLEYPPLGTLSPGLINKLCSYPGGRHPLYEGHDCGPLRGPDLREGHARRRHIPPRGVFIVSVPGEKKWEVFV